VNLSRRLLEFDIPIAEWLKLEERTGGGLGLDVEKSDRPDGKREYARDISNVPLAATIDKTKPTIPYPNFTEYQPKIAHFSIQNEENMAATIIFVIVSQGVAWHDLVEWFPNIMDWIRRPTDFNGNRKSGLTPYPKEVPWAQAVAWGRRQIDFVWANRGPIYSAITKSMTEDKKYGGTGFFVYKKLLMIPGLGLPKAGFAAQLIIGKFGCVDSVNLTVMGGPTELLKGNQFVNPKGWVKDPDFLSPGEAGANQALARVLWGKLSKKGEESAKLYVDYLDKLKRDGSSNITQQLWDDWCDIIAYKIWHGGTPQKALDVNLGFGKSRVLAYRGRTGRESDPNQLGFEFNVDTVQKKNANNLQKQKDLLAQNVVRKDEKGNPIPPGHIVGKQHYDLVQAGMTSNDVVANLLTEKIALRGSYTQGVYQRLVAASYKLAPKQEPEAMPLFKLLADKVLKQEKMLKSKFRFAPQLDDPYPSMKAMTKHIKDQQAAGLKPEVRVLGAPPEGGHPAVDNDTNVSFRGVHDVIAHFYGQHAFSGRGEYSAYNRHLKTLPPKVAPILFTEIVGQTSFYKVYGTYTEQKAVILRDFNPFSVGELAATSPLNHYFVLDNKVLRPRNGFKWAVFSQDFPALATELRRQPKFDPASWEAYDPALDQSTLPTRVKRK